MKRLLGLLLRMVGSGSSSPSSGDRVGWYYSVGDESRGPVTQAQLRDLFVQAKVPRLSLVWSDGMPDWLPAIYVPGLLYDPAIPPPDLPSNFVYMLSKAERYLILGAEAYRVEDALNMPSADCPEPLLAAIERGMRQICQFQGYTAENPFEDLGESGFYGLLTTLHFEPNEQHTAQLDASTFLDEVKMEHVYTKETIVLYNKVIH